MTRCLFCAIYTNRSENVRTDAEHGKEKMHKNVCFNKSALPTGALDSKSSDELLDLFSAINQDKQTIVMVTHSVKAASHAGRVLFIKDGEVFHQIYKGHHTRQELYQKISDTLTLLTTGGDRA